MLHFRVSEVLLEGLSREGVLQGSLRGCEVVRIEGAVRVRYTE